MRVAAVLAGIALATAVDVHEEEGFEHPNVHFGGGFTLAEVHVLAPGGRVVRRQLRFGANRHLVDGSRRLAQADLDAIDASHVLTRAKVLGLSQLALANADYSEGGGMFESWDADALAEPQKQGELLLAGSNRTASLAQSRQLWHLAMREATAVAGARWGFYDGGDRLKEGTGVASLLFARGTDRILAFRHTYSKGDYANIDSWLKAAIVDTANMGVTKLMKLAWTETLGFAWDATMQARASEGDLKERVALKGGSMLLASASSVKDGITNFVKNLVQQVNGQRIRGFWRKQATRFPNAAMQLVAGATLDDCYDHCLAWNKNASNTLNPCTHFEHVQKPADGSEAMCFLKGGAAYGGTLDLSTQGFSSGVMPNNPKVTTSWRYNRDNTMLQLAAGADTNACFLDCTAWNANASNALRPCTHFVHVAKPVKSDGVTDKYGWGATCFLKTGWSGPGEAAPGPKGFTGGVMPNNPKVTKGYRYRGRKPSQGLGMKAAATPDACFAQCVAWNVPNPIPNPSLCTHWVHVANPVKSDGVTDKYGVGPVCFLKTGTASHGEWDSSIKNFTAGLMQSAETASFGGTTPMALTTDEAKKQGYWPVTKAIVDSVFTNLNGGRLLLSGYSQGGARAQLARMYVQKKYGAAPPVVTFAAVGAQCFPRELYDGGSGRTNFLADVDPTLEYGNVTDYALALDPYGSNLGPDIGTSCYVGNSDAAASAARKYCGRVWGYSGPRIYYDSHFPTASGLLKNDFRICKYFTHSLMAVQAELNDTAKLFGNGTTDGTCYVNAPIPNDGSEADVCPQVTWSVEEKIALAGVVILILLFVGFFLTCVFKVCCKYCPCCPCGKTKKTTMAESAETSTVAGDSLAKAKTKHVV